MMHERLESRHEPVPASRIGWRILNNSVTDVEITDIVGVRWEMEREREEGLSRGSCWNSGLCIK